MKRNALPLLICLLPAVALAQTVSVNQSAPGYTSVTILSPQDQSTLHTNTGQFQVNLALTPALQSGNAISVSLDGTTLPTLRYSLQFDITPDEWESAAADNVLHRLQVAVVDDSGNTLISADPVQFYVHRASLLLPPKKQKQKP